MMITLSDYDTKELEMVARRFHTDPEDLVDSCLYFLPNVIKEDFGVDLNESYRVKYKTLLNAVLNEARKTSITGELYTANDEYIYATVKALEPDLYKKKQEELNL